MERSGSVWWDVVASAALLAVVPLYSPSSDVFSRLFALPEVFVRVSVRAVLVAAVVVGACLVVCCLRRRAAVASHALTVVAGAGCFAAGFALSVLSPAFGEATLETLSVVAGALLGAGSAVLCAAWGIRLARHPMRRALFVCALAVGLGAVFRLFMATAPYDLGIVVFVVLVAAGAVVPCVHAARGTLEAPEDAAATPDAEIEHLTASGRDGAGAGAGKGAGKGDATGPLQSMRRMAQVAGLAFVGLLVVAFATTLDQVYAVGVVRIEVVADIAAAVLVAPLALVRDERPLMPLVYQVILPSCAVLLMVLGVLPEGTVPAAVATGATFVLLSVVAVLALASLCAMAHAREFSPALIFSASVTCYAGVSFLGFLIGASWMFASADGASVRLVVCTLYFALILVALVVSAWRRRDVDPRPQPAGDVGLRERCDRVAAKGGLTPRESEVLSYIGRGHGITYTANALVISESTVRTHLRSIYHKLGVSCREELLHLIDAAE